MQIALLNYIFVDQISRNPNLMASRRILVTSALPNANGSIHLGHLMEHIQTDIWVRFQKLRMNQCIYVCADDAHGTATMLRAEELGTTPEKLIDEIRDEHSSDFSAFHINHDNYYSTHSNENRELVSFFYKQLSDKGLIGSKTVEQFYDPKAKLFLADRYVIGTCPKCGTKDQYGDNCEACGATYDATELKFPRSKISGETPILKSSEHLFFKLSNFTDFLREWTTSGTLNKAVSNKLNEWLAQGLKDWDISRDGPYFGFEIPNHPSKFFYVWLDAPIGYIASFRNHCSGNDLDYTDFWNVDSDSEVHHFIGKDIINFHALFWPAILKCAGFRAPSKIHVHGFLTVNGEKMSKSRGTYITAKEYIDLLDPELLRYYFASKLSDSVEDIDINLDDFVSKVNADLVGKLVNIASRCSKFIGKEFDSRLSMIPENELHDLIPKLAEKIGALYESTNYAGAVREIMTLADKTNRFLDENKPWILIKDPNKRGEVHEICSIGLDMFKTMMIFLKPVIPTLGEKAEQFLGTEPLSWQDIFKPIHKKKIKAFEPLLTRVDSKTVKKLVKKSSPTKKEPSDENKDVQAITIDQFQKVDLRVAQILSAEIVSGADKLLKLHLSLGHQGTRTVFSGIRSAYKPEELKGKLVVLVANLASRKMKFGISEGMILAASNENDEIHLLEPSEFSKPGTKIS